MPKLPPTHEGGEGSPAAFDAAAIFKAMRATLGLSQEKFAELVGMKRQQVSAYENGHHSATIDTLAEVASRAGLTIDVRVRVGDGKRRPLTPRS